MYHNSLYPSCLEIGKVWPWWQLSKHKPQYTKKCSVILRLLTGNHAMNVRRHSPGASAFCQECMAMVGDTVSHMLWQCEGMSIVRNDTWRNIQYIAPPSLFQEIQRMNDDQKTVLLLSGYGGYVHEWLPLFVHTADFITGMYNNKLECMNV